MNEAPIDRVLLGRVTAAYGIKGWVKIYSYTDPVEQILTYQPWYLLKGSISKAGKLLQGRVQGKGVVAQFADCETRNQTEEFIGYEIWVERNKLPELEKDEYYWYQLEGMAVINVEGEKLGQVDHMLDGGANDLMVVKSVDLVDADSESPHPEKKERLIPFVVGKIVKKVDLDSGQIRVDWATDWD